MDAITNSQPDKFSKVTELYQGESYTRLERFAHYLAGRNANPDNVMMAYDDIVGELLLELVKGLQAYGERLDPPQLEAVVRRMMDNRVGELRYRFYSTHRKHANVAVSLSVSINPNEEDEAELGDIVPDGESTPEELALSKERVTTVRQGLGATATRVFDAIVEGDEMLSQLIFLSGKRAAEVFKDPHVMMKAWHLADALHISENQAKLALKEIRAAYANEVKNEKAS